MNSVRALLDYSVAGVATWFRSFELCYECGYPLVNEVNLEILQFRLRSILVVGAPIAIAGTYASFYGLGMMGFASGGITAGSYAAAWQASMAGFVAKGSLFAILQSLGTSFMYNMLFGSLTGTSLTYLLSTIRSNAGNLIFCDCN